MWRVPYTRDHTVRRVQVHKKLESMVAKVIIEIFEGMVCGNEQEEG